MGRSDLEWVGVGWIDLEWVGMGWIDLELPGVAVPLKVAKLRNESKIIVAKI